MITQQMLTQKLPQLILQTPMRQQLLTETTFKAAHNIINQDIKKLHQSNFYQYINIHYGVKSKIDENLSQKLYKRKKQIIQYKIQIQDKYVKKLYRAQNQTDLQRIEKWYQQSLQTVKKRENQFDSSQFTPCIYIQAKKKRPFYGKLFQEFDRKGVAMLKATIGYRGPFYLHDRIQLVMETPPLEYFKKRNYYDFGINWLNPTQYLGGSTFIAGVSAACGPIFKGVDDKKVSASFGLQKQDLKIQLQAAKRYPRIHNNIAQSCIKGYHIPSTKFSLKLDRTLLDTTQKGSIMTGKLKQAKIQTTLPLISQAQFIKAQYNFRQFYDIYNVSQYFKNQQLKLFFQNSGVETNFNIKALTMKKNIISDFYENIEVRGFENDRRPSESVLQAKASIKLNNYNYPFFGGVGIVPFLYGQAGISVQRNIKKSHILGSTGIGLSFPLGKFIQLQLLYSLFQAQNRGGREPVNFQIRVGLMD